MKHEKWLSALWAFFLGSLLSCSAALCMVTAFDLRVDTATLIFCCIGAAAFFSAAFALSLIPLPFGAAAAALGYLWKEGLLEAGFEAILNRLTRQYNKAYNWGIIRWSFRTADEMEPLILIPLCVLGVTVALLVTWSVCRKKTPLPALLTALLPIGSCFVVTDTVPSAGWLFGVLLAFLVLLLTGSCRRSSEKDGNRLTLYLLPITALCLLVLFAVIPRDSYTGQDNAKNMVEAVFHSDPMQLLMGHMDNSGATGGESAGNTVDLRTVGYRVESDAQVLQVIAPFTGTLYLRGKALDKYDGTSWSSWSSAEVDYGSLPWPSEGLTTVGEVTVTTRFAHAMLYMPYYSDTMQLLDVSNGMENEKKLTQYSFQCKRPEDPAYLSRLYPTTSTAAPETQQQLAKDFLRSFPRKDSVARWAGSLANQITGNYNSPYHKAQAIASYVRNSATYDTKTSRMPIDSEDFAKWFLEESETGYCVHFATAAAVLLQEAGIPARYVTGYLVPVQAGEATPVLSSQAHAWVEYWLPGYGWTILEATPSAAPPTVQAGTEPEVTEPAETREETVPTETEDTPTQGSTPLPSVPAPKSGIFGTVLVILGAVTIVVGSLEGQRKLRLRKQQKLREKADPNGLALLYWAALVRYAKYLKELPDETLFSIAQMAKYSRHTVTEAQLARFAETETAAIARLKTKNLFLRLYHRWFLALY